MLVQTIRVDRSRAVYSGFVALFVAGLLFAPIFHRFLHRMHLDDPDYDSKQN